MSKPKLLIIGHGQHGKDTVADILRDSFGFKTASSSWYCARYVVMPYMNLHGGPVYEDATACFNDRHRHRDTWYNAIKEFNSKDPTKTARMILDDGYDVYIGMRDPEELRACVEASLFDYVIWVDASDRKPLEPESSMKLTIDMADIVIDNNGLEEELHNNVCDMMKRISHD